MCCLPRPGVHFLPMPNIASLLKDEIVRLARKTVRAETEPLRKSVGVLRAEVTALKKRTQDAETQLRKFNKLFAGQAPRASGAAHEQEQDSGSVRFSAKGLASNRKRLGLSAEEFGRLVGVSGQTIYHWEDGSAKPRAKSLAAVAALRVFGKKAATAKLAELSD